LLPLKVRERVLGVLAIIGAEGESFSEQQLALFKSIADQMSVAVENTRLYEKAEQMAVASERSRLARDLHDAVTQTLFSSSLIADVLPKLWEQNPDAGRQKLEELRQLTRGALSEMRAMLMELRPSALAEADMDELFRHLVNAFVGRSRLKVRFEAQGEGTPPINVKEVFYRVAQESLNNIEKHADAKEVLIQLKSSEGHHELIIRDDGRGFIMEAVSQDHLGLGIMQERAENIGALLNIQSSLGKGTEVMLFWESQEKHNDK
jgi:signal transduction histidine kinase